MSWAKIVSQRVTGWQPYITQAFINKTEMPLRVI